MHIVSIALGGCLKAEPVRYGITEDTGGHITYILGEMRALSEREDVTLAEIVTRRFDEPHLGAEHALAEEWSSPSLVIKRIDSGNPRYLAKEALAADREGFIRALIADLEARPKLPDFIHAHFADAAEVAMAVEDALGIPFIYTAHSLGMDKRAAMATPSACLHARIEEEDRAIARAVAVVGSSRDECERQLMAYPSADIGRIQRLVPGVTALSEGVEARLAESLVAPFLRDPAKPMVLAIARPVHKKNLAMLVEAFGASEALRGRCNLVILAGLRNGLDEGEAEQREVLAQLVEAVDRYDLYGSVAYPKNHTRAQVQALYALAARTKGVFVNPALTEPYGLTLVEAAAHGLPVVATRCGGPQDIVGELEHGLLVDPHDKVEIAGAIERLISDRTFWERCSRNGRLGSKAMDWKSYAQGFMDIAKWRLSALSPSKAPSHLLVSDLDNTLTGCSAGIARFRSFLKRRDELAFVIATGRSIVEAQRLVRDWGLPQPRAWITSVGSEIYYPGKTGVVRDEAYATSIVADWDAELVDAALSSIDGLQPQAIYEQRPGKRSYFAANGALVSEVRRKLKSEGITAQVIFSHGNLLDILPPSAGKAAAMRHVANKLGVTPDRVFAAGDSGNDADMLSACDNAILVGNHAEEVAQLSARPNVYLARRSNAGGALEGVLAHSRMRQTGARMHAAVNS